MTSHLTQNQLWDFVLGAAPAESARHLADCADCAAALAAARREIEGPLADFRGAALAWSERPAAVAARRSPVRLRWALALAALLIVAAAVPVARWQGRRAAERAAAVEAAQLARDNALLARVQSELAQSTPSPLQPLEASPLVVNP